MIWTWGTNTFHRTKIPPGKDNFQEVKIASCQATTNNFLKLGLRSCARSECIASHGHFLLTAFVRAARRPDDCTGRLSGVTIVAACHPRGIGDLRATKGALLNHLGAEFAGKIAPPGQTHDQTIHHSARGHRYVGVDVLVFRLQEQVAALGKASATIETAVAQSALCFDVHLAETLSNYFVNWIGGFTSCPSLHRVAQQKHRNVGQHLLFVRSSAGFHFQ